MPAILTEMEHSTLHFVKKNQHPKTNSLYLAAVYIKVFFVHFLSQCRMKEKTSKKISRRLQLRSGGLKSLTAPSGHS
jgi:hypothetical protein